MKAAAWALVTLVLLPDLAGAEWLLWKRSQITRRIEGVPRDIGSQPNLEKWELRDAVEGRKECLAALAQEFKKTREGLLAAYPSSDVSQSPPTTGISASLSVISETSPGGREKAAQLSMEYAFWCLPTGVDPRSTTLTVEKK